MQNISTFCCPSDDLRTLTQVFITFGRRLSSPVLKRESENKKKTSPKKNYYMYVIFCKYFCRGLLPCRKLNGPSTRNPLLFWKSFVLIMKQWYSRVRILIKGFTFSKNSISEVLVLVCRSSTV